MTTHRIRASADARRARRPRGRVGEGCVRTTRRTAVLLALVAACLLAVTACSVPGGYSVATLNKQPEAALTYPGSTEVQLRHFDGTRGNYVGKGGPAEVGLLGTTSATPAEVIAYYSGVLVPTGWTQTQDDPNDTAYPGRVAHLVAWVKGVLSYSIIIWTDAAATKYDTNLESTA
jgi:hypothetical protein